MFLESAEEQKMEAGPFRSEGNPVEATAHYAAVLTITDVALILRCSKAHVCNVLNGRVSGLPKLTHFAMGRRKLVRREWLEEWMEANKCQ